MPVDELLPDSLALPLSTPLTFLGAARQADLIRARQIDPVELIDATLDRIARVDGRLNAFRVVLADQARAEAERAGARVALGERLPLLGVPVAVKDDMAVGGHVRTMGSRARTAVESEDCLVVARLRAAGAIVVGITRTPELCAWPYTESVAGGPTRNPWNLTRSPGGSSGGSAAAVAAGLVGLATASDGAGSIRLPAAWNGLVGLKPTPGLVPTDPIPTLWRGMVSYGVVTRSVRDTALGISVMSGGALGTAVPDRRALRIGTADESPLLLPVHTERAWQSAVQVSADTLAKEGHWIVERPYKLSPRAFATGTIKYLGGVADDADRVPRPELLERKTRIVAIFGRAVRSLAPTADRWQAAIAAECEAIFDGIDVLMTPGCIGAPTPVGHWEGAGAVRTLEAAFRRVAYMPLWNVAGYPAISVPAGFDGDGLPLAVQLVGRPNTDATLLALAAELEKAAPWGDTYPPVQ